jgi:hypothetical protein
VVKRRIFVGQSLYAFGALLCIVNPFPQHRVHRPRAAQLRDPSKIRILSRI